MLPNLFLATMLMIFTLAACRVVPSPADSPNPLPADSLSLPSPTRLTPTHTPTLEVRTATPTVTSTLIHATSTPTPTPELSSSAQSLRPWRIMPLGDSLTSGNFPGRVHSYRGYLETLLREAGYSFDFVGTQSRPAHGGADPDHEGHSGFTIGPDEARFCEECSTANLYDHLEEYLKTEPDIVLLLIGINDLLPLDVRPVNPEDAPGKLARLVQRIQELRPGVYIFVASLAPVNFTDEVGWPPYQAVNQMAEEIAAADPHDRIFFVDVNRFLEGTLDREKDFADGVHLAEGGARKLAQAWFEALVGSGLLIQAAPGA